MAGSAPGSASIANLDPETARCVALFWARLDKDNADSMDDAAWDDWIDTLSKDEFYGLIEVGI